MISRGNVYSSLPQPRKDESREEFMRRFINDKNIVKNFSRKSKRICLAASIWYNYIMGKKNE